MDTKKKYLFIFLAITVFSTPAFSEVWPPESMNNSFTLLGKANPALAGIEQFHVFIVPSIADSNEKDRFFKQLDVRVKNRFKQAGIKVAPVIYLGRMVQMTDMPELKINIDMLKLYKTQRYIFRIQTTFSKEMYLEKGSSIFIKADVWKSASVMQAVLIRNMPAALTNAVFQQIEFFIQAYIAANPRSPAIPAVNKTEPVSQKQSKQPQMQQNVQYKYIASKNRRVFHRADCSSAKRISAKNLVVFSSRDEAINSGKRPCQRCKP